MSLKNILLTGSIKAHPSQSYGQKTYISSTDEQSFPIETFSGSNGGAFYPFGITQSWSGSNMTISGSVSFIHSTEDEFYNGEFSGSNLTVVNQSLNDCNIFSDVEVNYIPILYRGDDTLFVFQSNPNYISEAQFLLPENSPEQGEIYLYWNKSLITWNTTASGIIWIKINRFDSNGVDHTIQLEQLEVLRIKYNSGTIANFVINSITEYSTYYLYEVTRNNTISTADNEIKDYKVSVLKNTIQNNSSLLNTNNAYLGIGSWNTPSFNVQGYFDSSSGHYTQGNLSNIDLIFSASVQISSSLNEAINRCSASIGIISLGSDGFYYPLNLNLTSAITPLPQFANVTITLTGIISASYLSENSQIQLGYRPFSVFFGAWSQANISAASLTITQSVNPQTGSLDLTTLEPYIIEPNFYNDDCNPLINNALTPRYDNFYMDVDYTDQITAENREAILSNTAPRAQVQPYYYELAAQINPRYIGVRSSGSIQTYNDYFAHYAWIGSAYPEIIGGGNVCITKIIDRNGVAISPDSGILNNLDIASIFKAEETASFYFITGSTATFTSPIVAGASLYQAIMKKESGTGSMGIQYIGLSSYVFDSIQWGYNSISQSLYLSSSVSSVNNLWPLLTNYAINASITYPMDEIDLSNTSNKLQIWNKITQDYERSGSGNENIRFEDSLLPIQFGDYIRIGTSATINSVPLNYLTTTHQLFQIYSGSIIDATSPPSGSIYVSGPGPSNFGAYNTQAFVLYRRLDNPFFVVIKNIPTNTSEGLIIPQNYDPSLNYIELAKKAGVIT